MLVYLLPVLALVIGDLYAILDIDLRWKVPQQLENYTPSASEYTVSW